MKIQRFAIPKEIFLPGVAISVQVLSPKEMPKDCDADWAYTSEGKPRIRISNAVGIRRQRYLLYHELYHAIHDITHTAIQNYPKEVAP